MKSNNLIEVNSSEGTAYLSICGTVILVEGDEDCWLHDVLSFDLVECRQYWGDVSLLADYDCLDLGMTFKNGLVVLADSDFRWGSDLRLEHNQ